MRIQTVVALFLSFPLTLSSQTLSDRVLKSSTFQVLAHGGTIASCTTASCSTSVPLFTPVNVVCRGPKGETCTVAIEVQANLTGPCTNVSCDTNNGSNDIALLIYKGDGTYIAPDVNPGIAWKHPFSPLTSFTFVVTVSNTVRNQAHPVEIDLGCTDGDGDGCTVGSTQLGAGGSFPSASVRIDVLKP